MHKITEHQTAYSRSLNIEADFSKHVKSMLQAQQKGEGKTTGFLIAKASLEEKEAAPEPKENLSTTDKFFRGLYDSTPEEKKAERLLSEFHDESNAVKRVLKQIGFKGLKYDRNPKPHNPREYNLSLLRKE